MQLVSSRLFQLLPEKLTRPRGCGIPEDCARLLEGEGRLDRDFATDWLAARTQARACMDGGLLPTLHSCNDLREAPLRLTLASG